MNKDPLKRATIDELLNDPFVNGIDYNSDLQMRTIVGSMRASCCKKRFLAMTMLHRRVIQDTASVWMPAHHMDNVRTMGHQVKKVFDYINIKYNMSNNSYNLISKKELMAVFYNAGYSYKLIEKWSDDVLFTFGETMISKECKCDGDSIRKGDCDHEIEGISINGLANWLTFFFMNHGQFSYERDAVFTRFQRAGLIDDHSLAALFNGVDDSEYDMDEIKQSRVNRVTKTQIKAKRALCEVNGTGNSRVSRNQFIHSDATWFLPM